jgi:hypothetical protein
LIADGELAKKAVDSYSPVLFLPEDYDQPEITGISTKEYLASEPCYATPNTIISGSSDLLQEMIDDLKKTDVAALGKQASSDDRSNKVQNANPSQGGLQTGHATGNAGPKAGSSANPGSDVTGVVEDMLKEKEKGTH